MSSKPRSSDRSPIQVGLLDDAHRWDAYVANHPRGTHCHLFGWRRVAEAAYGRTTAYLAARRQDRVVGVLPLVWMPGRLSGRRLVSMPYLDLGGPLFDDPAVESALLEAALELADRFGARCVELRESGGDDADPKDGRYRFLLDLPQDTEALWESVGGKVRNQVRKAERSGLSTERVEPGRLSDFYAVFSRNMRDLGSPVHARRFLTQVFEQFGDQARLYLTTDPGDRVVAGAIGIVFGPTLTVPWASALRAARPLCPNHSLYQRILEDGVASSLGQFDFGRSSVGTGTYSFKKQWGAVPIPLAWKVVDRAGARPEAPAERSVAERMLVGAWRRLPLPVANRLGPVVRGRLSQ